MKHITSIILAAGSASRMGQPKQLLPWKDTFLLDYVIQTISNTSVDKTILVLGSNYNLIESKVKHNEIEILCNNQWEQGLGASIAKGLESAMLDKNLKGVLISLADQPLITSAYLDNLLMSFNGINSQIVASRYRESQIGVPAVFGANYFQDLRALNSYSGAKAIIQDNIKHVESLNASHFLADLDTIEDYQKLYNAIHQ